MSMAQSILDHPVEVSAEAQKRLNSARAHDISFVVKQRIGQSGATQDVQMLVEMILGAIEQQHPMTKEYVISYLRSRGRSPHRSEQLATALLG